MLTQHPLIFNLTSSPLINKNLLTQCNGKLGEVIFKQFPDGENYIRINTNIKNKDIVLIESMNQANDKIVALQFFAKLAKELGARSIGLVAPYLGYMRQNKAYNSNEVVSAKYLGNIISEHFDWLITVYPHHARDNQDTSFFSIPTNYINIENLIANWIKEKYNNFFLVGPDQGSNSLITNIAKKINCPYTVFKKTTINDSSIKIDAPTLNEFQQKVPIVIDDIITTGNTLLHTVNILKQADFPPPVCILIHPLFVNKLPQMDVQEIVTCNTITHSTNAIDLSREVGIAISHLLPQQTY